MRPIRALLAVLAVCALVTTPAAIAKQYAPPGRAGSSEYAEDIPTAGGNVGTPAMGDGNTTAAEIDKLGDGKAGVRKLAKLGKTGAAAAQFAQQTAPATSSTAPVRAAGPGTSSDRSAVAPHAVLTASGSAISGLAHLIGGSDVDGIGAFLPLLLVLGAVGAAVVGALRLRRPRPDAPEP